MIVAGARIHQNKFYYVCGQYIIKSQGKRVSEKIQNAYMYLKFWTFRWTKCKKPLKATLPTNKPLIVQNDVVVTQFFKILFTIKFSFFIPSNLSGVIKTGRALKNHPTCKQTTKRPEWRGFYSIFLNFIYHKIIFFYTK